MNIFTSVVVGNSGLSDDQKLDVLQILIQVTIRKYSGWDNASPEAARARLLFDIESSINRGNCLIFYNGSGPCGLICIDKQDWDSIYFNLDCYKISHLLVCERLQTFDQIELASLMISQAIGRFAAGARFVFSDADSWNEYHNVALQQRDFRYVLSWVDGFYAGPKFKINLPDGHSADIINSQDIAPIKKFVAEAYFRGGRFFMDANFASLNPIGIYHSLFDNSLKNGDLVFVYRIEGKPVGIFISKNHQVYEQFNNLSVAHLRYLVVDDCYRGHGIASNLFMSFVNYLTTVSTLIVTGLEVHNTPSLNLHSKLGFKLNYTHNAFHAWL